MAAERTIRRDLLATLWQVRDRTPLYWSQQGWLLPDARDDNSRSRGHPLYYHATVDAFHRENVVVEGVEIPSLAELLAAQEAMGKPSMLTSDQVADQLNVSTKTVVNAIRRGELAAVTLGATGPYRIPVQAVAEYAMRRQGHGAIKGVLASKILGVKEGKIGTLSAGDSSPLTRVHVPGSHGEMYVSVSSLLALVQEQLATGLAEDWLRMRIKYDFDPLLTFEQIRVKHHVHARTLRDLIERGVLPCIYTLGGGQKRWSRIPEHAVERWAAARRALEPQVVAQILGVANETASTWINQRVICRERHGRIAKELVCPVRACMERYIEDHRLSEAVDSSEWLTHCMVDRAVPVVASEWIHTVVGAQSEDIMPLLASGSLRGIRLPDGEIAIMRSDAVAYGRLVERRLRNGGF